MSISASQWGSPFASKRALLVHGLAASSNSWEGIAQLLVAEGFFVIAPNLLGHAWRQGNDYRVSVLAEDLLPYFAMDTFYDVIIGHSLGGTVALSLVPLLPKTKEITVILLDPALEVSNENLDMLEVMFLKEGSNTKSANEWMTENPSWSQRDCVLRTQGLSMCASTEIKGILRHNRPWSFSGLFKNIPSNVKITILVGDPKLSHVSHSEHIPRDVDSRVLTGIGHWIQFECPDAIMKAISSSRELETVGNCQLNR